MDKPSDGPIRMGSVILWLQPKYPLSLKLELRKRRTEEALTVWNAWVESANTGDP
jgi:hypothetical protein